MGGNERETGKFQGRSPRALPLRGNLIGVCTMVSSMNMFCFKLPLTSCPRLLVSGCVCFTLASVQFQKTPSKVCVLLGIPHILVLQRHSRCESDRKSVGRARQNQKCPTSLSAKFACMALSTKTPITKCTTAKITEVTKFKLRNWYTGPVFAHAS